MRWIKKIFMMFKKDKKELITDNEGHYDIDGVSLAIDPEDKEIDVVVASDDSHKDFKQEHGEHSTTLELIERDKEARG